MKGMEHWLVRQEEEGQVVWLLLDRPEKRNAFNHEVLDEMEQFLHGLQSDPKVRVLVISTTMDDMFTAGADIILV